MSIEYYSYSKYQIQVVQQPVLTPGVDPALNSPPQAFNRNAEYSLTTYNVENLYDYRDDPFDGRDFIGNGGCPGVDPPFDYVPASDAAYQRHLNEIAQQIITDLRGPDIIDVTAPSLSITLTPNSLRPANHKAVTVKASVSATDDSDSNPTMKFVSVASNEPDNGLGDGDTPNDFVKVDNYTFQLRAERSGTGSGRVYTFTYQAIDSCGNIGTGTAKVTVPRDQSK